MRGGADKLRHMKYILKCLNNQDTLPTRNPERTNVICNNLTADEIKYCDG